MEYIRTSILQKTVNCLRHIGRPFVGELLSYLVAVTALHLLEQFEHD